MEMPKHMFLTIALHSEYVYVNYIHFGFMYLLTYMHVYTLYECKKCLITSIIEVMLQEIKGNLGDFILPLLQCFSYLPLFPTNIDGTPLSVRRHTGGFFFVWLWRLDPCVSHAPGQRLFPDTAQTIEQSENTKKQF